MQFKDSIDHLKNPNQVVLEKMKTFYDKTKLEEGSQGLKNLRDNSMFQASRQLEREKLKIN